MGTNKRKGKRNKPPTPLTGNVLTDPVSGVVVSDSEKSEKALFRGFIRYINRPGSSIKEIWETENLSDDLESPLIRECISLQKFRGSAKDQKWRQRRLEHWREVKAKVLEYAQTEAVQAEIAEMEQLEALKNPILDAIQGNASKDIKAVQPKCLEGAVTAFVNLDKRISAKRLVVTKGVGDAAARPMISAPSADDPKALPGPAIGDELSDEEVAEMARALARKRAGLGVVDNGEGIPVQLGLFDGEAKHNGKARHTEGRNATD